MSFIKFNACPDNSQSIPSICKLASALNLNIQTAAAANSSSSDVWRVTSALKAVDHVRSSPERRREQVARFPRNRGNGKGISRLQGSRDTLLHEVPRILNASTSGRSTLNNTTAPPPYWKRGCCNLRSINLIERGFFLTTQP